MIERLKLVLGVLPEVELIVTDPAATGVHLDVVVPAQTLRGLITVLRQNEFLIEAVTGFDASPKMMVIHHFVRTDSFCRVAVRTLVDREDPKCPSIQDIYPGANWHERETHDFFGIEFTGHPDMSPLILPEDAGDLRPLLKAEGALKGLGDILPRFAAPKAESAEKAEVEK